MLLQKEHYHHNIQVKRGTRMVPLSFIFGQMRQVGALKSVYQYYIDMMCQFAKDDLSNVALINDISGSLPFLHI